ncbi:MAG: HlyD family secretion protein [Candidatus Symbiothrix sp.]|jgi:membrane fusion protein (multidrug efflux system)|nr:HlyD family secretion protein [Candidatus Symbiothrix sp.]
MNKRNKKIIINIVVIALIVCGIAWIASLFIHVGGEYTNNAYVNRDRVVLSSRVQGFVKKIYFDEFQPVHKGDTLAVIEDAEFRLRVAQAEADYQNALSGKSAMATTIHTTQNNISVSDAGLEEMRILLQNAEKDYLRYQKLLAEAAVTQQQYDGVKTNYDAMRAKYEMLVRQKQTTSLVKTEQTQRLDQTVSGIKLAEAALEIAKLNLSYTIILAPCDGTTGRKTIQEGELVMPGQHLLTVVSDENKWVEANFRETQMQHIHSGSQVAIEIDAFPGRKFEGVVASISNASGAQYSPVSPDHSVGNFVKVEQRIPVKIRFTEGNDAAVLAQLTSGMNVECKVKY